MKDRKFMFWVISTVVIVGLCAGLGYASYVVLYPPVANWLGHPTIAQQNEFFELAEKIGYYPENQLGFNSSACRGIPQSCSMILIFALDSPLREIEHADLIVVSSNESMSLGANLIAAFRRTNIPISLNGATSSLSIPEAPNYPRTNWVVTDKSTNYAWDFAIYHTSDYGYPVEIRGIAETRDFIVLLKRIK